MRKRKTCKRPSLSRESKRFRGDVFVVSDCDTGHYWDGTGWVAEWERAIQFGSPVDAFSPARTLADQLRLALGIACDPEYIPILPCP
jgi:hypothetical protein